MKSSRWMILFGYLLLMAGLANSVYGFRQTPSAFDLTDGVPAETSSNSTIQDIVRAIKGVPAESSSNSTIQDIVHTIKVGSNIPDAYSPPAKLFEESDRPVGLIPDRLVIASIGLDAPILPTKIKQIEFQDQTYYQWLAPNQPAVGWHDSSAKLGMRGNTVLNGHHNVYGKVFKDLVNVHEGDEIEVYSGDQVYKFRVALAMLLPERFKSLTVRFENARWILPTEDERLTLITCWPATSNTHRVIIVALPE
jgi:LPXTG-site transpeptidase (sortase) family protein